MRRFFGWIVCLAVFGSLPSFVQAMRVGPSLVELAIDPGGTQTRTIEVQNDETRTRTYYFQFQKFLPRGEQGQQEFLALTDQEGLPSWTFVDQPSITLQPNESRSIPITFRIPTETAPGGYYEAVFVSTVPVIAGQVPSGFRTGILFLVTVKGTVTQRLAVTQLERRSAQSVAHLPVSFGYALENKGGTHTRPQGFLVVRNVWNRIVERIPLNEEGSYILPGSRRQFSVIWKGIGTLSERPTFWEIVKKEWSDGLIGPYTVQVELMSEGVEGSLEEQAKERVVIWPWHALLVGGVIVVLLLFLLRLYRASILRQTRTLSD